MQIYRELGHFDSYGSIGTELAIFAVKNDFSFKEVPIEIFSRRPTTFS